jgi:hypothetical protein
VFSVTGRGPRSRGLYVDFEGDLAPILKSLEVVHIQRKLAFLEREDFVFQSYLVPPIIS